MKIQGKETMYDIGDIVIVAWADSDPELAVITGINLNYDDYNLDGKTSHILTYTTTRVFGPDRRPYEATSCAFLCKITDHEAVEKYIPEIRKAFIDHGFIDRGENEGEEIF